MGKKSRLKRERRELRAKDISPAWTDEAGMHTIVPALPGVSAEEMQKQMTIEYQKRIKASPEWKKIVAEMGEEEAEKLLKQCEAKIE
jgi:Cu/Ag efflux pump CusA